MFDHRVTVFVGSYGSGKTELSLNVVQFLAPLYHQIAIVDLDIVKPYFRAREFRTKLIHRDIRVILPQGELQHADMPSVSAEVFTVFHNPDLKVIMDVGGDDAGAVALGQYKAQFEKIDHEVLFVINTRRPFSQTADHLIEMKERIEWRSRLPITALVANTNLGAETTKETILEGYAVAQEVSKRTGLPIAFAAIDRRLHQDVKHIIKEPLFLVDRQMLPPWERNIEE
ncbi:hypothetical protein SDC9_95576 [bioreactor metagenome]|uniref:CobQ/CobB/MinD/ParA nucleotide binding domain-containing protein n=1 Tax=bioreactor metagenome TaxID=1076179 RepID=A0A645A6Q3_9ZZZZ